MCKLVLILLILTIRLSLSFSMNDSNCEGKKDSYELKLNKDDLDVVKFAEDGWNKLVAEGRTRGVNSRGNLYVNCVRVQVIDTERK
ncbi:Protein of unknown function [Cotesia congregata]|uniref:Uncharacterized protein n=1 Tax=Cotesia congregata TaxID=51543 RepID=A0A8J2HHX7_COTCN|nr:Protein of unknown function [Cotesia congregata]